MSGSDLLAGVFTYAGWAFLPSLATSAVQTLFYHLTVRAGSRRPQPGQSLYASHRRRIHILVLILYLIYTLLQTFHDIRLARDFYTDLGVSPSSSERDIRSKFRRLAARFHPDKLHHGSNNNSNKETGFDSFSTTASTAESAFVHLKLAHDTLLDPARRFAYDRFGPSIVQTQQPGLKTIRDYVYAGLRSLAPEYVRGGMVLLLLNWFWLPRWGMFWRYVVILSLATLELYFLTHEWRWSKGLEGGNNWPHTLSTAIWTSKAVTTIFENLPPFLLPFQILTLARRLSISLNIFISQLAPSSSTNPPALDANNDSFYQQKLNQLTPHLQTVQSLATRTDAEAKQMLDLELSPFKNQQRQEEEDEEETVITQKKEHSHDGGGGADAAVPVDTTSAMEIDPELRDGMVEGLVRAAIQSHPDVRDVVERASLRRRREIATR